MWYGYIPADVQTIELISAIQVLIAVAVLIPACVSDWRYREVSNVNWIVLGVLGTVFCMYEAYIAGICWQYVMMVAGMLLILTDICSERERSVAMSVIMYAAMLLMFSVPVITMYDDALIRQFAIVPLSFVVFYVFYLTGMIGGGADVKCLMTMTMMFQTYPSFLVFPLISIPAGYAELLIPFPFALLFHAALFAMSVFVYIAWANHRNGDSLVSSTYRMDVDTARRSHVWVRQDVTGDMIVDTDQPNDPEDYRRMEVIDTSKVRVTPKIPFIIPISAAFLFIVTVGNLLFLPF